MPDPPREGAGGRRARFLHLPLLPDDDEDAPITWNVGDMLMLCGHPDFPRAIVTAVSSVSEIRLLDMPDDDLVKLNVSPDDAGRAEYLKRWDEVNPSELAESNPRVLRIEFNYNYAKVGDSIWALGT